MHPPSTRSPRGFHCTQALDPSLHPPDSWVRLLRRSSWNSLPLTGQTKLLEIKPELQPHVHPDPQEHTLFLALGRHNKSHFLQLWATDGWRLADLDKPAFPSQQCLGWGVYKHPPLSSRASLVAQLVNECTCNAGDTSSIPGSGRSPGEGNGNPLQCSCLENFMNTGYSPWSRNESDMTKWLTHQLMCVCIYIYICIHTHIYVLCVDTHTHIHLYTHNISLSIHLLTDT